MRGRRKRRRRRRRRRKRKRKQKEGERMRRLRRKVSVRRDQGLCNISLDLVSTNRRNLLCVLQAVGEVMDSTSRRRMISLRGRALSFPPMKVVVGSRNTLSRSDSSRP